MKRSKPRVEYHGISLAVPLIEEIKKYIADKDEYRSVAAFVTEAIRKNMNETQVVKSKEFKIIHDDIKTIKGWIAEIYESDDFSKKTSKRKTIEKPTQVPRDTLKQK